jgi:valyl-tRNA synthetase
MGADALRFMLMSGSSPGNDMRYLPAKLESMRNFANKLWNASRFVIMNLGEDKIPSGEPEEIAALAGRLRPEDHWILTKVRDGAEEITRFMEKFELSLATERIYEMIWNEYCDWYIEMVKSRLYGEDEEEIKTVRTVLISALSDLLRLLHPFMPFITEEIWGYLGKQNKLIVDRWAGENSGWVDAKSVTKAISDVQREDAAHIELARAVIRSIRNIRAEADAAPSRKLSVIMIVDGSFESEALTTAQAHIERLAGVSEIRILQKETEDARVATAQQECASAFAGGVQIYVPLDDLLDYAAEKARLEKEQARLEGEIARLAGKLSNEGFVAKAPQAVVDAEREKLDKAKETLEKVVARARVI